MSLYLGKSKIGNVGCGPIQIGGGTDTSDATVTASDLANGVIAYGKNGKVTGNVATTAANATYMPGPPTNNTVGIANGNIYAQAITSGDRLLKNGSYIKTIIQSTRFGNATAADVAAGKTFTSSAGLKVTGTASSSGGTSTTAVDSIKSNAQIKKESAGQVAQLLTQIINNNAMNFNQIINFLGGAANIPSSIDKIEILFEITTGTNTIHNIIASCDSNNFYPFYLPVYTKGINDTSATWMFCLDGTNNAYDTPDWQLIYGGIVDSSGCYSQIESLLKDSGDSITSDNSISDMKCYIYMKGK